MALSPQKQKWVDALRSGKYEQARRALHYEGDGYCCLGVACDLAMKNGVSLKTYILENAVRKTPGGTPESAVTYDGMHACLPTQVQEWLGGVGMYGEMRIPEVHFGAIQLSELNDNDFTFDQIADVIEWYYGNEIEEENNNGNSY